MNHSHCLNGKEKNLSADQAEAPTPWRERSQSLGTSDDRVKTAVESRRQFRVG